jgi:hypothetical protein
VIVWVNVQRCAKLQFYLNQNSGDRSDFLLGNRLCYAAMMWSNAKLILNYGERFMITTTEIQLPDIGQIQWTGKAEVG